MNYLKLRRAVAFWFIVTLVAIVALIVVGVVGSNPAWGVTFAEQFKLTLTQIGDTFNVLKWGDANYPLLGAIVTLTLTAAVLLVVIGWIVWIVRTKRYINFLYIFLLIVSTFLVLHYSENFVPHFEYEINTFDSIGLTVTALTSVLIVSMLFLMIFALMLDYLYLYIGQEVKEVVEVTEETIVIKEETKTVVIKEEIIIHETIINEVVIEEDEEIIIVDEDENDEGGKTRKLRIPFALKLKKATPELREAYNEIKAYFLSYGFNSRISIAADTFRLHTKTYAKIQVSGKSLRINFALNPSDYAESTIPVIDSGDQKIYEEIPLTFKVKSGLSVKRSKILIDTAAEVDALPRDNEEVQADYARQAIASLKKSAYYLKHFNGQ